MNKTRELRSLLRRQDIVYFVPGTGWDEALPMGDGCFGAMMYQEGGAFQWTLNHLDVYMAFQQDSFPPHPINLADVAFRAHAARRDPSHPGHQNYSRILSPEVFAGYGWLRRGVNMNIAGQVQLETSLPPAEARAFEQRLNLFNASVVTRCRWPQGELRITSFVSRQSRALVIEVEASKPGLIRSLGLNRIMPPTSMAPTSGRDNSDCWLSDVLQAPAGSIESRKIEYSVYARLLDERGHACPKWLVHRTERMVDLRPGNKLQKFTFLVTVATEEFGKGATDSARLIIDRASLGGLSNLRRKHQKHWRTFWAKSQIELADSFLEKLWYVNLYALACSDGTGMQRKSQATGLNGLWDIKNPNGWGSCWYWDVNIQESYWGCYTSNHLEMAQPFYDGLSVYVPAARRWAKEWYGRGGIAIDYPIPFYHCLWPWCCQFLWWGYRYSMDKKFLREVAYPVIREVLQFCQEFFCPDKDGRYSAFPSVSPEQGPLGPNPTILLATVRYLLRAGIEASRILKTDASQRMRWAHLLKNLAPFPMADSSRFGTIFKDSEWASPDLYLAHPSPLMSIYPTGLIGPDSPKAVRNIARNTLAYAESLQALGTFNFGWLSACASRLGLGDEAVRLIYEKGVSYLLRPNGLMAEESDRFIHNCHVLSDPLYLPPMSECSGGIVGAVNEMLLQSRDSKIRIFPAVPSAWSHARFCNLLAEGALEVSAEYREGRTAWVKIQSRFGGRYRLVVNGKEKDVQLAAGEMRELNFKLRRFTKVSSPVQTPCYTTPARRRIWLGKTAETEYLRQLDRFLFDYNIGDTSVPKQTKYKFDFGPAKRLSKNYAAVIPQQLVNNKIGADFYRVHPDTLFTEELRFGWEKQFPLRAIDRRKPDALRRDFVYGDVPADFCIELPCGQYQLLFLMGDAVGEFSMSVKVQDQFRWRTRKLIRAGNFAVEVFPVRMVDNGVLKIHFTGQPWKLNALMVNRSPL